jgi:hypothetical protein
LALCGVLWLLIVEIEAVLGIEVGVESDIMIA